MKKILGLILVISSSLALSACGGDDAEIYNPSNYETVEDFQASFEIPDADSIVKNIYLPDGIGFDGNIIWSSDNSAVLSPKGFVNRPLEDTTVNLTATAILGNTKHRMYYTVTVKGRPTTESGLVNEAADDFYVIEDNYIDRDIMVLSRVTDINGVYVSDWKTSNDSIIDTDGNVYRTDQEQKVTLTATFSLGVDDGNAYTTERSYEITVGGTSDDEPDFITLNDSRIKRKVYVDPTSTAVEEDSIESAFANAQPGDAIVLTDGIYRNITVELVTSGTEENPIFVLAENNGKAIFSASTQITITADYVTIANLNFSNGYPAKEKGAIVFDGSHLRFTNNKFDNFEMTGNDYKWISLIGDYHEIDRNVFDGKSTGGALLTIWREEIATQYHHIHLNQFLNFKDTGGANGYETIRIGTSDYSQSYSNVLVEDNLFEKVSGEIEIISIKAGRTIVRNNTFSECIGLVTARHGKNNLIEGNAFLCNGVNETGGVRLYDGGHTIRNNYVESGYSTSESRGGVVIQSGVQQVGETTTMNLQWTPYNILVEGNTIVDTRNSIVFCGKYTVGGRDIFFINNFITDDGESGAVRVDMALEGLVWEENLIYGTSFCDNKSALENYTFEYMVPTGVSFYTSTPTYTSNKYGMKLHSTVGVQEIGYTTSDTTGVNW